MLRMQAITAIGDRGSLKQHPLLWHLRVYNKLARMPWAMMATGAKCTTCATFLRSPMKTVNARQANHEVSELLSRLERGEEILITKRSKPVALLSPYRPPLTPERQAAIDHAIEVMAQGLPWGATVRAFTRDEMHECWRWISRCLTSRYAVKDDLVRPRTSRKIWNS